MKNKITFFSFLKTCLASSLLIGFVLFSNHASAITKNEDIAIFKTDLGIIKVKLLPDSAPKTVENFRGLINQGKYNGNIFHRVIKGFMIQGGDFTNHNGTGGNSIWGKPFADEISKSLTHKRGVLSMANAGPNTNTSQFFITHADSHHLNGKHTIFGEVIEGMDTVDKIASVPVNTSARPLFPVSIQIHLQGGSGQSGGFSDQAQIPNWAEDAIKKLTEQGIIKGNDDGSFAPNKGVNRAELAKIIVLATGIEVKETAHRHFSDVPPGAWFHPYVEAIYDKGWINGYPDGTFKPDWGINRAEIAKIVANAFELSELNIGSYNFQDVNRKDWFFPFVQKVYQNQIMTHDGRGYFFPGENLKRAQAAKIVYDAQQK